MSDLSPEAKTFLEGLRHAHDPTPDDRARVRTAVLATVAASTASTVAATAKASVAGASAAKSALVFYFLGGVAAAVVVVGMPTAILSSPRAQESRGVIHELTRTAAAGAPARSASPEAEIRDESSPAVPAEVPAERPRIGAVTPPAEPRQAAQGGTLDQEIELIRGAQEALQGGRAEEALRYLDEHARRFPKGVLVEERNGAWVVAVCTLKRDGGPLLARNFLAAHPASPFAARIRAQCRL